MEKTMQHCGLYAANMQQYVAAVVFWVHCKIIVLFYYKMSLMIISSPSEAISIEKTNTFFSCMQQVYNSV